MVVYSTGRKPSAVLVLLLILLMFGVGLFRHGDVLRGVVTALLGLVHHVPRVAAPAVGFRHAGRRRRQLVQLMLTVLQGGGYGLDVVVVEHGVDGRRDGGEVLAGRGLARGRAEGVEGGRRGRGTHDGAATAVVVGGGGLLLGFLEKKTKSCKSWFY